MVKCPNPDCGYENVDGTQFCEGCGEELPQGSGAASIAPSALSGAGDLVKCPACENLNPPENVVCEVCGTELHAGGQAAAATVSPDPVIAPPVAPTSVFEPDAGSAATSISAGAQADLSAVLNADPAVTTTADADVPAFSVPGLSDTTPADDITPVVAAGDTTSGVTTPDTIDAQLTPAAVAPVAAAPAAVAPAAGGGLAPGSVKLVVEQGMTVGKQFVLGDAEVLVGREDDDEQIYPDIDLSDQDEGYVHRKHATLRFADGNLTVEHLGGANKTRLNNRPLQDNEAQTVKIGDKIAFGKVVMRVQGN